MKTLIGVLALTAILVQAACTKKKETPKAVVSIVHQSNRQGEIEPCGCDINPFGGLDRELNALTALRKTNDVIYVDAGNLFLIDTKRPAAYYQEKATALVKILGPLKLDAYSPGDSDLALGEAFLKGLEKQSSFKWVSSNLKDANDKLLFAPYVIVEKGGAKFAITGVTNPAPQIKTIGIEDPKIALAKILPEMRAKSDYIVLLSQLSVDENEALAKTVDANIVVGGDVSYASDSAEWYQHGKTLMVDSAAYGYRLGQLDLTMAKPFKGFTSFAAVRNNLESIILAEDSLKAKPKDQKMKAYIARLREEKPVEVIPGGTEYSHQLIKLDKEHFGEPNAVTKLITAEKERIRQKALSE